MNYIVIVIIVVKMKFNIIYIIEQIIRTKKTMKKCIRAENCKKITFQLPIQFQNIINLIFQFKTTI